MKYLTLFSITKNGIPSRDRSALVFNTHQEASYYVSRFRNELAGYIVNVREGFGTDRWYFDFYNNTVVYVEIVSRPKGDVRFDVSYSVGGNDGLRRRYSKLELAKAHVSELIQTFSDAQMDYYDDDGEWNVMTRNHRVLIASITIVILGGRDAATNSEYEKACAVLGVKPGVGEEEAKSVFRQLSKIYHPDMPNGSAEKFKEIKSAYEYVVNNEPEVTKSGPRRIVEEYSYLDIIRLFKNAEEKQIHNQLHYDAPVRPNINNRRKEASPFDSGTRMLAGIFLMVFGLGFMRLSPIFLFLFLYGLFTFIDNFARPKD